MAAEQLPTRTDSPGRGMSAMKMGVTRMKKSVIMVPSAALRETKTLTYGWYGPTVDGSAWNASKQIAFEHSQRVNVPMVTKLRKYLEGISKKWFSLCSPLGSLTRSVLNFAA
ncbi:hypothetical protein RB213_003675 [Colletotrichum asianum]